MKRVISFCALLMFLGNLDAYGQNLVDVHRTNLTPNIDGSMNEEIWNEASELTLANAENNNFKVLVTFDRGNLYIACLNLKNQEGIRHHAEILIDTNLESSEWDEHTFWFHSSHSNCSSTGAYFNWKDCNSNPGDWIANTFPFTDENNHMEFKISFAKLGVSLDKIKGLRFAVKVSNPNNENTYWPEKASVEDPSSWGQLHF